LSELDVVSPLQVGSGGHSQSLEFFLPLYSFTEKEINPGIHTTHFLILRNSLHTIPALSLALTRVIYPMIFR
jgi:hypothetical protein